MRGKRILLFGAGLLAAGGAAVCLVKISGGAKQVSFDLRRDRPGDSFTGIREQERGRSL